MGGRALETLPEHCSDQAWTIFIFLTGHQICNFVSPPLRLGPKKIMACVTKSKTLVRFCPIYQMLHMALCKTFHKDTRCKLSQDVIF